MADDDHPPAVEWMIVGETRPKPVSLLYKLGLAAVALVMVLLPIIYVGIIVLVAWGVYEHALHPRYQLGGGTLALFGYSAPIIVGGVLVFFMIKPLFARQPKNHEPHGVLPGEEPELFRLIYAVCDTVRAPRPARVLVDLQVNASAGFRRGFSDLLRRRLTLSIGLPLVAGLNVRQFGGVLSHEFGHFSQGAGMSLTFIVRSVNAWFARVVYERDAWDDRLRSSAERSDFRFGIILHLARAMVWVTRRILWLLMNVGHAVSCFMMRQMEFDADRFESQVAGSETFAETTRRFQLLNASWQITIAQQSEAYATNRLVNDLPGLSAMAAKRLDTKAIQSNRAVLPIAKTGWFDTHPSDHDRIEASKALGAVGMLHGDDDATKLFRDFRATTQALTKQYYEKECGIDLKDVTLHSLEEMSTEALAAAEEDELVERWFGSLLNIHTLAFVRLDQTQTALSCSPAAPVPVLTASEPFVQALLKADGESVCAGNALHLLNAGFVVNPKNFGLKKGTREEAEAAQRRANSQAAQARTRLADPLSAMSALFGDAVRAAQANESTAREQLDVLEGLISRFPNIADSLLRLHKQISALELLLLNAQNAANSLLWKEVAENLATSIDADTAAVLSAFSGCKYPFRHARGNVLLSDFLCNWQEANEQIGAIFGRARCVLQRSLNLHYRVLARLASLVEHAKSSSATFREKVEPKAQAEQPTRPENRLRPA
jgi:Zn-dependent protease with chaperone function